MSKVLVLHYSTYGHTADLAAAVAEGARSVSDTEVVVKRVPELMPAEVAEKAGLVVDFAIDIADPAELVDYDAIIFGTPTRFGNMASQMRNFLDQTGGIWVNGGLIGKVASVFVSTGTGGGNETTITSFHTTLFHHGMIVVGLSYSAKPPDHAAHVLAGLLVAVHSAQIDVIGPIVPQENHGLDRLPANGVEDDRYVAGPPVI